MLFVTFPCLTVFTHNKHMNEQNFSSAHGTFLGRILLEPHKPQQVPVDSTMLFRFHTGGGCRTEWPAGIA